MGTAERINGGRAMGVTTSITRYLDRHGVNYGVHHLAGVSSLAELSKRLGVSPRAIIRTAALNDRFGLVLVVTSANEIANVDTLSRKMGRKLEPATTAQVLSIFRDCDGAFIPPLGEAYGVRTIIDDSLVENEFVYFCAGDATEVIQITSKDFFQLQNSAWLCSDYTTPVDSGAIQPQLGESGGQMERSINIRTVLQDVTRLPPMPKMAQQIIRLSSNPYAGAKDLAKIVELDPSLSAQVMRYARSPFFAYQGEVDSLGVAISRVLGFDMVMNLTLGLATAQPFRVQRTGPVGLDSFWRHAVYSAALAQSLCAEIPANRRPKPALAYLAGLLHNFGHLLIGHLLKREFTKLNEALVANPEVSIIELEQRMFEMHHGEVGALLLGDWGLPDEIVVAVREHHNATYDGPYATYSRLLQLVDHVLKGHGMGDALSATVPPRLLADLGITEVQTLLVINRVLEGVEGLNSMAQNLAA